MSRVLALAAAGLLPLWACSGKADQAQRAFKAGQYALAWSLAKPAAEAGFNEAATAALKNLDAVKQGRPLGTCSGSREAGLMVRVSTSPWNEVRFWPEVVDLD